MRCTAGCPLSIHSTRHPLHTPLYKDTLCVHRGCERGRTYCGCTTGRPLSTHSTRHPLHTPLYKNTLCVHRGCERGRTYCGAQQGVHCPHTAHDTPSTHPFTKTPCAFTEDVREADMLWVHSRVSTHRTRHPLCISTLKHTSFQKHPGRSYWM